MTRDQIEHFTKKAIPLSIVVDVFGLQYHLSVLPRQVFPKKDRVRQQLRQELTSNFLFSALLNSQVSHPFPVWRRETAASASNSSGCVSLGAGVPRADDRRIRAAAGGRRRGRDQAGALSIAQPRCVPTKADMITRRSHVPMRRSAVSDRSVTGITSCESSRHQRTVRA